MIPKTHWAKTVDGASIAYQDFGTGPVTLVVIHGWVSHLEVYWEQPRFARFMTRLSRNLRVLHFDKRGTGMSDRIGHSPDLETRMDDVRAVLDAAGIQRAALLGWGGGGPPLALFFAASHPERTLAVCTDSAILERQDSDYPWGTDEEEQERNIAMLVECWGDEERVEEFVNTGFGDTPEDAPRDDPQFLRWCAKLARFAATPGSYAAFERMWYATDVRDVLHAVRAPTMVLFKAGASEWGDRAHGAYLADRIPAAQLVGIPGTAGVVWIEDPEPLVAAIESFVSSVRQEEAVFDRVLATVLFTDIVGSTTRSAELGDTRWNELLQRHHRVVRALLARYRGKEISTAGDGFLATFDGPARAVRCADAIVEAMTPLGLEIRAGLHTGEIEILNEDVGGIAVSIGARVGSMAGPSEVLVSQTVRDLVAGSGIGFHDRGVHALKGVPGEWQLFIVERGPTAMSP